MSHGVLLVGRERLPKEFDHGPLAGKTDDHARLVPAGGAFLLETGQVPVSVVEQALKPRLLGKGHVVNDVQITFRHIHAQRNSAGQN